MAWRTNAGDLPLSHHRRGRRISTLPIRVRVRTAVMRGELVPDGVGPRGTLLFTRETLDRMIRARMDRRGRLARPAKGNADGETHASASGHPSTGLGSLQGPSHDDLPHDGQEKGARSDRSLRHVRRSDREAEEATAGALRRRHRGNTTGPPPRLRDEVVRAAKATPQVLDLAPVRGTP